IPKIIAYFLGPHESCSASTGNSIITLALSTPHAGRLSQPTLDIPLALKAIQNSVHDAKLHRSIGMLRQLIADGHAVCIVYQRCNGEEDKFFEFAKVSAF